jgi:hypothetical protein
MKQVTKNQFFRNIDNFNMKGNLQIRDAMPSETKFSDRYCSTVWRCQKTRNVYGKSVTDTHGINEGSYFLAN